ncbi:MAG: ribosome-associated translation inhibitor RaiA [Clostridia bacterium]|nr:ribosome-associated translation inhibitor RaiA [Clostridia bacterium]MBR4459211.1 ribosome-associated translation inhibitor RaiA [Clostridia bacterium]
MKMTLTARNMTITPGIEQRIHKKTARMERYLLPDTEMQIKMRKDKNDLRVVEITVPMGNGVILRSEAAAESNLFLAIDDALAKVEKQIHRHRTKLGKRIREDAFTYEEPEYIEEDTNEEGGPKVVRTKTFPVRPMSVEDAAIQMEMLGHSFFAFVNIDTDRINVLYQRKDGNFGLLEPEA